MSYHCGSRPLEQWFRVRHIFACYLNWMASGWPWHQFKFGSKIEPIKITEDYKDPLGIESPVSAAEMQRRVNMITEPACKCWCHRP